MESNKQVILFQRDEVALGYKYKLENPLTSDIKIFIYWLWFRKYAWGWKY